MPLKPHLGHGHAWPKQHITKRCGHAGGALSSSHPAASTDRLHRLWTCSSFINWCWVTVALRCACGNLRKQHRASHRGSAAPHAAPCTPQHVQRELCTTCGGACGGTRTMMQLPQTQTAAPRRHRAQPPGAHAQDDGVWSPAEAVSRTAARLVATCGRQRAMQRLIACECLGQYLHVGGSAGARALPCRAPPPLVRLRCGGIRGLVAAHHGGSGRRVHHDSDYRRAAGDGAGGPSRRWHRELEVIHIVHFRQPVLHVPHLKHLRRVLDLDLL